MDLFENPDNQANTPTGQERSPEWEDAFAGMQKLDLFEEEPEVGGPETDAPGVTQLFDLGGEQPPAQQPAPRAAQPAAPEVPLPVAEAPKAREKEIGKAVFQSLFAGELEEEEPPRAPRAKAQEEQGEPAVQLPAQQPVQLPGDDLDVQPLAAAPTGLFEETFAPQQPAVEVPVPQAAPAQPEAPAAEPVWQAPAAPAPQAPRQEASVPVFEQPAPAAPAPKAAFVPDPVPRRAGGPKPIDWHADLLSRIDAARQAPAAPAAPAQQPAPAQPAAPAPAAEEPAWKPILESAMMDHIPSTEADEAATKVFQPAEPAAPAAPQGAQPVPVQFDTASLDLDGTGSFTVPREPAVPSQPPKQEQPAPSARDIASNIAASFGDDDDDFDATLSGIDLSDYPDTSELEQRAAGGEPTSEDIFGSLYDADPDGEDDPPKPRRTRTVQDYPAKKSGGNNKKTVIFVAAALLLLVVLVAVYFLFLKDKDHKDPAPSGTSSSSSASLPAGDGSTSLPADSVPADSIPVAPVVTIPRDEWYMKLVNRDHALTKEEADAITTTNVGGVPVDSRAADAFNQLIAGAKEAGYTLTLKAGYRTYDKQDANYKGGYTDCPAGASEHNLGLSADIFTGSVSSYDDAAYRASAEYQWLKENAASYGFIERYPEGTKDITGFDPEPWHWRYVGSEQAPLIQASGLTMEQYLA